MERAPCYTGICICKKWTPLHSHLCAYYTIVSIIYLEAIHFCNVLPYRKQLSFLIYTSTVRSTVYGQRLFLRMYCLYYILLERRREAARNFSRAKWEARDSKISFLCCCCFTSERSPFYYTVGTTIPASQSSIISKLRQQRSGKTAQLTFLRSRAHTK